MANDDPFLKNIDLQQLLAGGSTFEVNFDDSYENEGLSYTPQQISLLENFRDVELYDEECFVPGSSFDSIKGMESIWDNGKIKKKVIRDGYGETPKEKSSVSIHYNAYTEYSDEPFDSTYIRGTPQTFNLLEGAVIPGLDFAVSTMKMNEKSQFLIHYEYAFGKLGCFNRIPPESTILFEVELKDALEIGLTETFLELSDTDKKDFPKAYEYAIQACTKGNNYFLRKAYKFAVREYNRAISILDYAVLKNMSDQEKQQTLLLRLLTNKAVVHTKLKEPKPGCSACNRIYQMVKGTSLKIKPKVYYNNAKCLIMLHDLDLAEKRLKIAQKMQPLDENVAQTLKELEELKKENKEKDKKMAINFMKPVDVSNSYKDVGEGSSKIREQEENEDTLKFKSAVEELCTSLLEDDAPEYALPENLNKEEIDIVKQIVTKFELFCRQKKKNNVLTYFVSKTKDV